MPPFQAFRPHPWHGIPVRPAKPDLVHAYIEITPFDAVKYEVDKATGYLKVDRPQLSNSLPPTLYGFIPQTYCGERVAALYTEAQRGDGDPLDICVISERPITHNDILLYARIVGGLLMIDNGEADDKIIAVLDRDAIWGNVRDLADLPPALIDRLRHYFMTYKLTKDAQPIRIDQVYDRAQAERVLAASEADYQARFSGG